jgi:nucleotide-binding universal stress UspA family protein
MFERIMVLLDGSGLAEQALPYAEQLVAALGGTLHLTRVVEQPAAVRAHSVGAPVNVYEGLIADQRAEQP